MGAVVAIQAGLMIAATAGKIISSTQAAQARERALQLRLQQEKVATEEKQLQRLSNLNSVLAQQTAQASARGISLASPTLGAITEDTLEQYRLDVNAEKLNALISEAAIAGEIANARSQNWWNMINTGLEVGQTFMNASNFQNSQVMRKAQNKMANGSGNF